MNAANSLARAGLIVLMLCVTCAWANPPAPPNHAPPPDMAAPDQPPPPPDMAPPDPPPPPDMASPGQPPPPPPGGPGGPGCMRPRPDGNPAECPMAGPGGARPDDRMRHARMRESAEWLRANNPKEFERLQALHKENPDAFRKEMRRALQEYAKKEHPEQYKQFAKMRKSEERLQKLAKQYRAAQDPAEKTKIEQDMRTELEQQFAEKQKMRQQELEALEKRLNEFRASLLSREQNKEAMIDMRIKALTEGPDAVNW